MSGRTVRTVKPTKVPGLPAIPADASPGFRRYLEALSEALEIRLGRRGDVRDRAVTLRELIETGLAVDLEDVPFDPNNPSGGIGNPNSGSGGNRTIERPTQPTGFSATGGYELISLFWTVPSYRGHSLTEIWRYDSDIIGDAILIGVSSGRSFVDPVGEDASYYYWIRHVNVNGVAGNYNSANGTLAETAENVTLMLDILAGAITSSELATSLATPIGNLPADTSASIANLQSQINTLSTVATWASGTSYSTNDLVTFNGNLYEALQAHTASSSNQPSGTTSSNSYWTYVGAYTSLAAAVAGNTSDITDINYLSASSGSAAAQKIADLDSTVNDPSTGVSANASAISGLTTRVTNTENATTTNSSDITSLENTVNDGATGVNATATAVSGLTTRVTATENATTANSADITALENTVNDSSTGVTATATALSSLTTRVTNTENATTANSSDITALENTVNDSSTGVNATASALSSLTTTVTNQGNEITAAVSDITTLNTTVGNNSTSIQTNATSINGLHGQYTVKIDTNGHVSGFGLANTTVSGTPTSAFIVRADKFAVIDPADTGNNLTNSPSTDIVPFIIDSGNTYLRSAMIQDASITNAKIGNAAVDNAKIANLDASKVNAGTLSTSRLDIDNVTLTANEDGALAVDAINANQITAGSISATVMSGTTVYANRLTGDVNKFLTFRTTESTSFAGTETQLYEAELGATSHLTDGHKVFCSVTGWYDCRADRVYRVRMYMRNTTTQSGTTLGTPTSASPGSTGFVTIPPSVTYSGDLTDTISVGTTLTATGKSHTVSLVLYSSNTTTAFYTIGTGSAFTTSDSLSTGFGTSYQLVGESRFKARTNIAAAFSISGGMAIPTTSSVYVRVTIQRYASGGSSPDSGTALDYLGELAGVIMGVR